MESNRKKRVCPVEQAGSLDNRLRRWVQNPKNILSPYIQKGMTVLDFGCGPGFFTLEMASMVGESGRVIAVDLQKGMIDRLRKKIQGTALQNRIILHQCEANRIGVSEKVDFILAFYMLHEVPNQERFFNETVNLLKTKGQILIVEPPFHVSKTAFEKLSKRLKRPGWY